MAIGMEEIIIGEIEKEKNEYRLKTGKEPKTLILSEQYKKAVEKHVARIELSYTMITLVMYNSMYIIETEMPGIIKVY